MICSQCKRVTVSKRANCFYCGGRLIFEEKKEHALQCPGCRSFMKKVVRADITVDECQNCNGKWFDRSELEQLLRKSKSELQEQPKEEAQAAQEIEEPSSWPSMSNSKMGQSQIGQPLPKRPPQRRRNSPQSKVSTPFNAAYRRCPHCKDMMNRNNYLKSGIIVDVCRKHGVYLDDGEFDDLHQFVLHNPMGF